MRALGQAVARLRADKERDYLERCLELGQRLRQARTRLAHGSWGPWLKQSAKLTQRTAHNYVSLSTWADEHPRQLVRWRSLGVSRLFLIASASDATRRALQRRRVHTLADMSVPELRLLLARLAGDKPPPSTAHRVRRLRRRLQGVVREVHALLDAEALDSEQIESLRSLLREASEALHA